MTVVSRGFFHQTQKTNLRLFSAQYTYQEVEKILPEKYSKASAIA